jgi:hypothetical protein
LSIAFRVLVPDSRSYARSGGRPRLRLIRAIIPVTEGLRGRAGHVRLRGSGQRDSHHQEAAFGWRCGYLRGARIARLGAPTVRRGLPLLKGPPRVPDPGQLVELRMEDGSWRRGFRALSEPSTTEGGEVVVWVATEDEYRAARGEGRSAVGVPWPTERMVVSSSGPPWQLSHSAPLHPAPPRSLQRARRRWWTGERSADLEEDHEAVGLWILLAIALLTTVAAAYSLLTATGVLGGG